jgi:hypothetical protein
MDRKKTSLSLSEVFSTTIAATTLVKVSHRYTLQKSRFYGDLYQK